MVWTTSSHGHRPALAPSPKPKLAPNGYAKSSWPYKSCFKFLVRPLKGRIRPFKGLIRLFQGLIKPLEGRLSPFKGLIRSSKDLIRALKGPTRALKGLIRPFKDLLRPFKGPVELLRTQIACEMDRSMNTLDWHFKDLPTCLLKAL